jgi:hypothetical protein
MDVDVPEQIEAEPGVNVIEGEVLTTAVVLFETVQPNASITV